MPREPTDGIDTEAMLSLTDADFLRGLKASGQYYLPIIRIMNERIERIAKRLECIDRSQMNEGD